MGVRGGIERFEPRTQRSSDPKFHNTSRRTIRTRRRGSTPLLTSPSSAILRCAFRADVVHPVAGPTYWSSACVLLAVALYDTNTVILGRRILTTTLSDERNAYNPLNRQQRLTTLVSYYKKRVLNRAHERPPTASIYLSREISVASCTRVSGLCSGLNMYSAIHH